MPSYLLERYLQAAQRENTQRSYASAVRHFEVTWGGLLPATADSLAGYLVAHATSLSINTLRQRLAALSHWHRENGFSDPTTAPLVKNAFKGIQALHPAQEKRASPLQLTQLDQVIAWLEGATRAADAQRDAPEGLRLRRDKAMLLLGFWRGFRTDELVRLEVGRLTLVPGQGMTCFLPRTKGDRQGAGTTYRVPALSRLCPVTATVEWVTTAQLADGPVFRSVDRWGHVANTPLHTNSVPSLLRQALAKAGLTNAAAYSGHSLRRGFASWANANGWDVKALMEYVGWKDVHSAMRYVDGPDAFGQQRIEAALTAASMEPKRLSSS